MPAVASCSSNLSRRCPTSGHARGYMRTRTAHSVTITRSRSAQILRTRAACPRRRRECSGRTRRDGRRVSSPAGPRPVSRRTSGPRHGGDESNRRRDQLGMRPVLSRGEGFATGSVSVVRRLANDERVAFVGVGAVNTFVGAVVFVGLQTTLGRVAHYLLVLVGAHIISVLCAFALHRRMVFKVTGSVLADLFRFQSVYLVALVLNATLLYVLVEFAGLPVMAAQFASVAVT